MAKTVRRKAFTGFAFLVAPLATVLVAEPAMATPDTTPPTPPAHLRVQDLSFTRVTLAWDPSTDNAGWTMYTAELRAQSGQVQTFGETGTTKTFTPLTQGMSYTASVWAVDGSHNESAKVSTQFTVPVDSQPPTAPANLRTVYAGSRLDAIVWDPSADNSAPLTYYLYSGTQRLLATTDPRASVYDLLYTSCVVQPGSTHTLTVQARDVGNNLSPLSGAPLTVTFPS